LDSPHTITVKKVGGRSDPKRRTRAKYASLRGNCPQFHSCAFRVYSRQGLAESLTLESICSLTDYQTYPVEWSVHRPSHNVNLCDLGPLLYTVSGNTSRFRVEIIARPNREKKSPRFERCHCGWFEKRNACLRSFSLLMHRFITSAWHSAR
jgi:hypothetical protein